MVRVTTTGKESTWRRLPMCSLIALLLASSLCAQGRPNILWITSEDNGPHLGCYGDLDADTPHLDALSERGLRFERCWSNAPVCAPARTTIITGMYATSLGAEHMRSMVPLPADVRLFPAYLREAGYYCTNRSKEDYNVPKRGDEWDESGKKAHWRNRAKGQPFFSVINLTVTHEAQVRKRPHTLTHSPDGIRVPGYHPDDPIVRRDWAQYHDKMTEMDRQVGRVLSDLEQDGLADDTIVFYFGDHGPGLPRCKRWPYDSGLRVPLIVHVPDRFRSLAPEGYGAGESSRRLVSFVDLAPTVLGLAGVEVPGHMQGSAFAGDHVGQAPTHLFGYRGRMDERIDLVRSVTDGRWVYIRNFMPHRIQGAHLAYMFQTPTTRRWKELYDAGELKHPAQRRFWEPKPMEELFDLGRDPDETVDLALVEGETRAALDLLRAALYAHMLETRDLGLLPESELLSRARGGAPRDIDTYPLAELLEVVNSPQDQLSRWLEHEDAAIRTWAVIGLMRGTENGAQQWTPLYQSHLDDPSPAVRIAAAEALAVQGVGGSAQAARSTLIDLANLTEFGLAEAVAALNALDALPELSSDDVERLANLPTKFQSVPGRLANYVPRLIEHILARHPPARVERVYKTIGELELSLFVHHPKGPAPSKGWGAVVFFHGGGWNGGNPNQFFDQSEHLARRGIVAISVTYRLSQRHGATPDQCVADGKSALRWVRAHAKELSIDPNRIAAGGGSAGGQIAAAVATTEGFDDEPESLVSCRPNALVLFNPVFDNGPGGWGHSRVEQYWEAFSPLHNISAATPPSLVMLGCEDTLVPIETAQKWKARMEEVGGSCLLELYEGQPHGFFNRAHSAQMYTATVAAMDAFLDSLGWL
ncbi:MAG: arylsulfatase A-like enzyme/acetyl esterase/lipase [Planctomycetota bacterium]|jgi:arylsulfatase A-like enzyme/acetyl esterase/lipase